MGPVEIINVIVIGKRQNKSHADCCGIADGNYLMPVASFHSQPDITKTVDVNFDVFGNPFNINVFIFLE